METRTRKKQDLYCKQPCPRCGARLILRHGTNGYFWGCTNFRTKGCTGSLNWVPGSAVEETTPVLEPVDISVCLDVLTYCAEEGVVPGEKMMKQIRERLREARLR